LSISSFWLLSFLRRSSSLFEHASAYVSIRQHTSITVFQLFFLDLFLFEALIFSFQSVCFRVLRVVSERESARARERRGMIVTSCHSISGAREGGEDCYKLLQHLLYPILRIKSACQHMSACVSMCEHVSAYVYTHEDCYSISGVSEIKNECM
jgi:hypothetical protein